MSNERLAGKIANGIINKGESGHIVAMNGVGPKGIESCDVYSWPENQLSAYVTQLGLTEVSALILTILDAERPVYPEFIAVDKNMEESLGCTHIPHPRAGQPVDAERPSGYECSDCREKITDKQDGPWELCSGCYKATLIPLIPSERPSAEDVAKALELAELALAHDEPGGCWAAGPLTGNEYEDLVVCPGCRALKAIAALTQTGACDD